MLREWHPETLRDGLREAARDVHVLERRRALGLPAAAGTLHPQAPGGAEHHLVGVLEPLPGQPAIDRGEPLAWQVVGDQMQVGELVEMLEQLGKGEPESETA